MKLALFLGLLLIGAALADHSGNSNHNGNNRHRGQRRGRLLNANRRDNNNGQGSGNSGAFRPHTAPIPVPQAKNLPLAAARTPRQGKQVSIPGAVVRSNAPNANGEYDFQYQTDDGVNRQEQGQTIQNGAEDINEITGQVSWTSPEGELVTLNYVANENGYQPTGSHVPVDNQELPLAIRLGQELIQRVAARDAARQG
ncbi:larval cuticle protein LCP-17-like [Tigriopus californicus]|uniref:larval cuticle protein LCP-17-like n=1 Tax=Tigriopus californicus TaxID=6832 RepID=UPI0027DA5627|nr:larval cuticle protein LCP-17-like [Tigriopus californicus]XP_059089984.1 larval cuticle protein LCP-17-like [Tigriopus californicus]XP_059089985.1 larval cuticle protein LCP-17-like [Tigriopus californicus]XP_059089986.1 larval cuticle protein LCP-17-like [Tigriopus californicus]XP_059089987.1 larval cuticle protein LCP-17-like [Tigriopus californicus]XP_059089988.1 larval cuticle protein LCP-17-like [Tigriopus californicus]|eukprot:TCALIF_03706-PA protein Name:"Similar to Endocuticle structural glycoprotein SgAbd-2 (Schistocerca gregaria)" AED:0.03 eAED:0.03 QI:160/1/0.5/1/0.66/0.5/4/0/197